jgi:AraC-like DNA-binding protein
MPPLERARVAPAYARTGVDLARELGIDTRRLVRECGLPDLEQEPVEDFPVKGYLAFLEAAARDVADPFFGLHVGERVTLSAVSGYGAVLCVCKSFRETTALTIRYEGLLHDLGRSELVEEGDVAAFRWHSPWLALPGARHMTESVAAGIRVIDDWLAGRSLPVREIALPHPPPEGQPLDEYRRILRGPVRFDAEVAGVSFDAALLDLPLANTDPTYLPAIARALDEALWAHQRARTEPLVVRLAGERIAMDLSRGDANLTQVAGALGLSARTLQRQLAAAGTSFSDLLAVTRLRLAERYLSDPSLSLAEIALLLGFGDQSSFTHAFRGWFGTTPAAWRARSSGPGEGSDPTGR